MLSERIVTRTNVLEQLAGVTLPLPDEQALEGLLAWSEAKARILHMDIRSANILSDHGRVRALVDWSNALVGEIQCSIWRGRKKTVLQLYTR